MYEPRHTTTPRTVPFEPPQLQRVLDETAAFSVLVAQTKQGNGTAVYLLEALFGSDPLERVA